VGFGIAKISTKNEDDGKIYSILNMCMSLDGLVVLESMREGQRIS